MSTQTGVAPSYTIMETATLSGLPESTLRYYETIGLIDPIKRNTSSKHRVYSEDDVNIIISIACLNNTGMSLKDMRTYLKNRDKGVQAASSQVDLLKKQQQRLAEEAHYLQLRQRYVETKIAYWQATATGSTTEANVISENAKLIAQELNLPKHV